MKFRPIQDRPALRPPASWAERGLIACGIIGPVLFNAVYLVEGATRSGYDALRLPVSALSLTGQGWMQITNFEAFGALVCGFAFGLRKLLTPGPARTWAPLLQLMTGLGLVVAGIFVQDPGQGYPAGAAVPLTPTFHGEVHLVATVLAFNARLLWSIVMALRFSADRKWRGFAALSGLAAFALMAFLAAFGATLHGGGPAGLFERLATLSTSILTVAIAIRILSMRSNQAPIELQPSSRRVAVALEGGR